MIRFAILTFLYSLSTVRAADESGCLIRSGKSLKLDENCACLQNQSCVKFKKFTADETLLNQTDSRGRGLFTNNEKSKMRDSFKVYDQIIKLRLAGKANSDEIKDLYKELDTLNKDVRSSFLKTQGRYLDKSKSVYRKSLNQLSDQKLANLKVATDSVNDKVDLSKFRSVVAEEEKSKKAVKVESAKKESRAQQVAVSEKNAETLKTDIENEMILKNIKPEKLERGESDSLFDIITKSYMKSAYPKLLKPKEQAAP